MADYTITSNADENITGVIPNTTNAMQFRARIPDKMALKEENSDVESHKIFITNGEADIITGEVQIPHVVGKNIIDAVNDANIDGKIVTNATNATNATNVALTATANNDGSTTIKAGTGSAKIENCINAKVADTANWANNGDLSIDNDSTNGDKIWIGKPSSKTGTSVNINNAANARYALYASSDTSKGTIEERLTNLGFREGSVLDFISGTTLKAEGKYAILQIPKITGAQNITGTLSFNSKQKITANIYGVASNNSGLKGTITIDGHSIHLVTTATAQYGGTYDLIPPIGFEIE